MWMNLSPEKLGARATAAIRESERQGGIVYSPITMLELAGMMVRGKLNVVGTVEQSLRRFTERLILQPLTLEISAIAAQMPRPFPGDPADRIIGATAVYLDIPLVTKDRKIRDSGLLQTIW